MECYTTYINKILRFYARNPVPQFCKEVDKLNWQAADKVLSRVGDEQKQAILSVFFEKGRMADNVMNYKKMPPHTTWRTITSVSRAIAEERGLI